MARCFHLRVFEVFVSVFVVLKGPSEILVLLVNPGNGILINLIFKFSEFLNFSALFSAIVQIFCAKQNGMFHLQ